MEAIFVNLISTITGGLVTDMTGVITALVFLSIVLMGFDWIKDIFEQQLVSWGDSSADGRMEGVGSLNGMKRKANKYKGTAEGDVYSYQYKKKLKEYVTDLDSDEEFF